MSPTEFDLRRALHDGEGDGVDPEHIVFLGRTRRAQRRSRVLSTAAAVVLVGALGTGAAFLARSGGNSDSGGAGGAVAARHADSTSAAASSADAAGSAAGGGGSVAVPAPIVGPTCPSSYPTQLLPGGGSPGQFGSDGPMFAKTPVSLLVCAYGADGTTGSPASLFLTGAKARTLADSLEHARTARTFYPCPQALDPKQNRLAIIGTAADGTTLRTVTTEVRMPQCNVTATNGTALRYQWQPPSSLASTLLALTPRHAPAAQTTDTGNPISKSPVR